MTNSSEPNHFACACGKHYIHERWFEKHKAVCTWKPKPQVFACGFCTKSFSREALLGNHVCEAKRRYLQREDKSVKLAFAAYERFYRSLHREVTLPAFEKSKFYAAFVRFARYLMDLNAIHPLAFVDFLLRLEVPVDRWTNPTYYGTYIRELNKNETPNEAFDRNLMLMEQWANDVGEDWRNFFRKLAPAQAVQWIISGRISPWVLFTASSAAALFDRMTEEQMTLVNQAIDAKYWRAKIARHQEHVDEIRAMMIERNI